MSLFNWMPLQTYSGSSPVSSNKKITKETWICHITSSFAWRGGRAPCQSQLPSELQEQKELPVWGQQDGGGSHTIKAEQHLERNCNQQGNGLEKAVRGTILSWQFSLLDHQASAVIRGSSPKKYVWSQERFYNDPGVCEDTVIQHHLCKMHLFGTRIELLTWVKDWVNVCPFKNKHYFL